MQVSVFEGMQGSETKAPGIRVKSPREGGRRKVMDQKERVKNKEREAVRSQR